MKQKQLLYIGIAVVAAFVLFPGLIESLGAMVGGQASSCEDTPYDADCFCEVGIERKISVPWIGVPRWSCETLDELLIDPESANFETEAIAFAEEYLSRWCQNIATDFTCGTERCISGNPIYPETKCISAVFGYGVTGERVVNVECVEVTAWDAQNRPTTGRLPWRMEFYVESTTDTPVTMFPESNYYYNETTGQKCTHQSYCDYVADDPYTLEHPGWCVGDLPLDVRPFVPDFMQSIFGAGLTRNLTAPGI